MTFATFTQKIHFQWQNPVLRQTIYPFRIRKLLDFLLYYYEIDLWKKMGKKPVDASVANELIRERNRLQNALEKARQEKEQIAPALKALQAQKRDVMNSQEVRELIYKRANLQAKLASLQAQMNITGRRVDWYAQFAPEHPYYERYTKEYELAKIPFEGISRELKTVTEAYESKLTGFESQAKNLNEKGSSLDVQISLLQAQLGKIPSLEKDGSVSTRAAVLWLVHKYEQDLMQLDHDKLLAKVLEKFDRSPRDYPKWLEYMVIHFSGMRYQSAHGSLADPRDLLISLKIEELINKSRNTSQENLDHEIGEALKTLETSKGDLQTRKLNEREPSRISSIDSEMRAIERQAALLNNSYTRQRALLDFQINAAVAEIKSLSEAQILASLKAMKGQFPEWVWKEIVSRTSLRLEVTELDWDTLTPEQVRERWAWENQRWRAIMDAWENKDITAWKAQHQRTFSLIVSRAVCNEIAEHIQHLRGLLPVGGLAAKPVWYLNSQKANPGKAYFKRPVNTSDLRPGASILFLGWVTVEPNAWQTANPLAGADLLPASARPETVNRSNIVKGNGDKWVYRMEGNKFVRSCQPMITQTVPAATPGKPTKVKIVKGPVIKEWLRWTHEATVVDVAEMADGVYVLTFETGQIGINRRPLTHILNRWDIFVGYIPESLDNPVNLDDMLDRRVILPPPGLPRSVAAPSPASQLAFSLPVQSTTQSSDHYPSAQDALSTWKGLTRREKQVVVLLCQGNSTRQIATLLDTSTSNVNSHISHAMRKFGLRNRHGLCAVLADWDFSSINLK